MWIICAVWLALCFILPYFGMMFFPLFSILLSIDIWWLEFDLEDKDEAKQFKAIFWGHFVLIFHHFLLFYLIYWDQHYGQFGVFPVNFFIWILPNLIFLPLVPVVLCFRMKYMKKQKQRNRVANITPVVPKMVKKSNRSEDDSTIRELSSNESIIEIKKLWMEFMTPSLYYFKNNSEIQQEFHCVPHFDIKKLKELYYMKKRDENHLEMLNYDPQNVFTSVTNNFFTIMKQYSPTRDEFCDLCFLTDIKSKIHNNRNYAKIQAAGRDSTTASFRIRLLNTEFQYAYIVKKVWVRNQVNKNYIALAHRDRNFNERVSLISSKTRKAINRIKVQRLQFHEVKAADLVVMKDGSLRLFVASPQQIALNVMKKKSESGGWKGLNYSEETHGRGDIWLHQGDKLEMKVPNRGHHELSFMNMSFYDDLMCLTFQKYEEKSANFTGYKSASNSEGMIVAKITLGRITSGCHPPYVSVVSILTDLINSVPFNHKIDYTFFLDSNRLAFLMFRKIVIVEIKKKRVIHTIPIANYFDFCRFEHSSYNRDYYFVSALLNRSRRKLHFNFGQFEPTSLGKPSQQEFYFSSNEMVNVRYCVSGVINLAGLIQEEEDEDTMLYAKPQDETFTNKLEVFSPNGAGLEN